MKTHRSDLLHVYFLPQWLQESHLQSSHLQHSHFSQVHGSHVQQAHSLAESSAEAQHDPPAQAIAPNAIASPTIKMNANTIMVFMTESFH